MSNVCFGFKATPFLCQCTFLYCFCLSLKRPKWRICLSAVALLLLFRLRLLKLLHRCTPDRWVCSKRSTLQVPSWGTVSFPSHPKPAHCNVPTIMPSHFNILKSIWQVSLLVPVPIPTINWPRGFISGLCMAFLGALNRPGFTDSYDFFYLPMDTKNRASLGYAWLKIGFSASACFFHLNYIIVFFSMGVLCLVHFRLEMENRSQAEAPTWVMPSSTSWPHRPFGNLASHPDLPQIAHSRYQVHRWISLGSR